MAKTSLDQFFKSIKIIFGQLEKINISFINMQKAQIRLVKYSAWIIVNFLFCLIPIAISAIIINKVDDSIFSSYISFSYTLLITSFYAYKSAGRDHELLFWGTLLVSTLLLIFYMLFPHLLAYKYLDYLRNNFLFVAMLILIIVLIISFLLNVSTIEEQVENKYNSFKQRRANETEKNVKGIFDQLKREG